MNKKKRKIAKKDYRDIKKTWPYKALLLNIFILAFLGATLIFIGFFDTSNLEDLSKKFYSLPAFGLKSAEPSGADIHLFPNDVKKFSIEATEYETIKWYLDNILVEENSESYEFSAVEGNHTLKAVIQNENLIESKSWNIVIEKDEIIERPVVGAGEVIFYLIVVILGVIMLLVVWLFVLEKSRPK